MLYYNDCLSYNIFAFGFFGFSFFGFFGYKTFCVNTAINQIEFYAVFDIMQKYSYLSKEGEWNVIEHYCVPICRYGISSSYLKNCADIENFLLHLILHYGDVSTYPAVLIYLGLLQRM